MGGQAWVVKYCLLNLKKADSIYIPLNQTSSEPFIDFFKDGDVGEEKTNSHLIYVYTKTRRQGDAEARRRIAAVNNGS